MKINAHGGGAYHSTAIYFMEMSLRSKQIGINMLTSGIKTARPHLNFSLRNVLIVGERSLFQEGLEKLLSPETGMSVISAKYTNDPELLAAIAQTRPDVILVNESTTFDSAHILELLFSESALTILQVVVIRLDNNIVDVYEMPKRFVTTKRFVITRRDDFVDVVLGKFQHVKVS